MIRCYFQIGILSSITCPFITYCLQLQLIQNAAARVLTNTTADHIASVLRSLHWLPFSQRKDFKILLLAYKALQGLGPSYITDLLQNYEPSGPLRSSGTDLLSVPELEINTVKQRLVFRDQKSGTNSQKTAGLLKLSMLLNQD